MGFREFLKDKPFSYMWESFDSPLNIGSTVKYTKNITHYYIVDKNISKQYRIFIEQIDTVISVGFERYYEDKKEWDIHELTHDLSNKEILGLFSTVIDVINKRKNISGIMFGSIENKKQRLYINIAQKMSIKMKLKMSYNDNSVFLYKDEDMTIFNKKWTYKKI